MIEKEKKRLGASIVKTGRLLTNSVNSQFLANGADITFEQLEALLYITMNAGRKIIQKDLADILHKNKSGILRTIDILEKKQFVKRIPAPGDRRKNVIEATAKGIETAKNAIETFNVIESAFINKIHPDDIATCNKVLDIIKDECRAFVPENVQTTDEITPSVYTTLTNN